MEIKVEIVAVDVQNKGKYKVAEVTHKQDGKTNTKKVMSFGAQEQAFKFLSSDKVKKGDLYLVEINKNSDGYWDWTKVSLDNGDVAEGTITNTAVKAPSRGNYETPEERAFRQVMITRQSSINYAILYLNHNKKNYEVNEILALASDFEEFVFGKGTMPFEEDVPM